MLAVGVELLDQHLDLLLVFEAGDTQDILHVVFADG